MPEMTNNQIAERLREIAAQQPHSAHLANYAEMVARVRALANELQRKPEFKERNLVRNRSGVIGVVQSQMGNKETIRVLWLGNIGEGQVVHVNELELLEYHASESLDAILCPFYDKKPIPGYISTDGLPELPEGEEYVIVGYHAYVKDQIKGVTGCDGETVHIGRKKRASEQPSPTGES